MRAKTGRLRRLAADMLLAGQVKGKAIQHRQEGKPAQGQGGEAHRWHVEVCQANGHVARGKEAKHVCVCVTCRVWI